ncbi:MltR family transcriptional regulator [Aquimarina macrocephali]|uniref:MltR family transcriptional regulator n=1 Tax=Aquimarina macrocephali TaxID=666563 RepID=UPI00046339E6|nr:MltR family transcriptional regulator [Aquimarina macrocephali]
MELDFKNSLLTGKVVDKYFDFNQALIEFSDLFNEKEKNERSIAILGGTFLEMTLEHILYSFLPENEKEVDKLFEYNCPLGNFSNKIQMAYCLGLIERIIKKDLNLVRKIRNKFAHNMFVTFNDNQIESWCNGLEWHKVSHSSNIPVEATNLMIFQVGVNQLITNLNGHIDLARNSKRKILNNFE